MPIYTMKSREMGSASSGSLNLKLRGCTDQIFDFPLYISTWSVIFTFLALISESTAESLTGEEFGIQPMKVWFGYAACCFCW
jgi:hypothetical protein